MNVGVQTTNFIFYSLGLFREAPHPVGTITRLQVGKTEEIFTASLHEQEMFSPPKDPARLLGTSSHLFNMRWHVRNVANNANNTVRKG